MLLGAVAMFPFRDVLLWRDLGLSWPAFGLGIAFFAVTAYIGIRRKK